MGLFFSTIGWLLSRCVCSSETSGKTPENLHATQKMSPEWNDRMAKAGKTSSRRVRFDSNVLGHRLCPTGGRRSLGISDEIQKIMTQEEYLPESQRQMRKRHADPGRSVASNLIAPGSKKLQEPSEGGETHRKKASINVPRSPKGKYRNTSWCCESEVTLLQCRVFWQVGKFEEVVYVGRLSALNIQKAVTDMIFTRLLSIRENMAKTELADEPHTGPLTEFHKLIPLETRRRRLAEHLRASDAMILRDPKLRCIGSGEIVFDCPTILLNVISQYTNEGSPSIASTLELSATKSEIEHKRWHIAGHWAYDVEPTLLRNPDLLRDLEHFRTVNQDMRLLVEMMMSI
ncbi:hypothetical protein M011DRAFT_58714 [Sporormia fimetaria CBS 119925]|uniref:Uncharacterized protein n=1 Tax=Sporormia fimetaria CBS 119925 TaxID=1340428 RepID=A0A6A6V9V8_9PLEO|nr:hypothetical protein M011DRAFT_58714 [Sporormia fimetaria CBS 119925]